MKTCRKCLESKDLTQFHNQRGGKFGVRATCKSCSALYVKENRVEINIRRAAWRAKNPTGDLAYRERTKAQKRTKSAEHYQRNQKQLAEKRAASKEKNRLKNQAYYRQHKDRLLTANALWRAANPERNKERLRKWQRANPGMQALLRRKRKILQKQATPNWANNDAMAALYATAAGLNMLLGEWHHVDHIVPLSSRIVCGLNCEANLRVVSGLENMKKGNRHWPGMP